MCVCIRRDDFEKKLDGALDAWVLVGAVESEAQGLVHAICLAPST